jgi:hypothetical protein
LIGAVGTRRRVRPRHEGVRDEQIEPERQAAGTVLHARGP